MTVRSGLKCLELSTSRGPLGSLERMLAASSAWNSTKCLLTWNWKATPQGRSILELSASTPRTAGCESGLLLTPRASEGLEDRGRFVERNGDRSMDCYPNVTTQIAMLHTPSGQEPGVDVERLVTKKGEPAKVGERAYDKQTGRLAQVGLVQQIAMMPLLKTPSSVETEGGVMEIRPGCDGHYKLRDQIAMLPSPRAGNPGSRPNQKGGKILAEEVAKAGTSRGLKLQPIFCEWMMGYPAGWTNISKE